MSIQRSNSKSDPNIVTIAFYNLENLFDTKDNPRTLDDDFTPNGKKKWSFKRYRKKVRKLAGVIAQLGTEKSNHSPALIGVVEAENLAVLQDLINHDQLINEHYGIVHYDSPDERGIDVALLYKKELFEYVSSETFPLYLEDPNGERDYTRDVLHVTGNLNGERMHILVNHWPSRRSGSEETEAKRVQAALLNNEITDVILEKEPEAKIIIMGDFNDDPISKSVKHHLVSDLFYNPMESILQKGMGTSKFKKNWHLFDQIIFSKNFLDRSTHGYTFKYAHIFDRQFLKIYKGKLRGSPFRTYIGKWYKGGFSDHFPVYIFLEHKKTQT